MSTYDPGPYDPDVAAEIGGGDQSKGIKGRKDWPLLALYEAEHDRLRQAQDPDDDGLSDNHTVDLASALLAVKGKYDRFRNWLIARYDDEHRTGFQRGEQPPCQYTWHHAAALIHATRRSFERKDAALYSRCLRHWQALVNVMELFRCPDDAHHSVRGQTLGPGCRNRDPAGADKRTDVLLLMAQRRRIPFSWRIGASSYQRALLFAIPMMERLIDFGALPKIEPTDALPRVRNEVILRRYQHGHHAWAPTLRRCAGFPVWEVLVRYRSGAVDSMDYRQLDPMPRKVAHYGLGQPELPALRPVPEFSADDAMRPFLDERILGPDGPVMPLPAVRFEGSGGGAGNGGGTDPAPDPAPDIRKLPPHIVFGATRWKWVLDLHPELTVEAAQYAEQLAESSGNRGPLEMLQELARREGAR